MVYQQSVLFKARNFFDLHSPASSQGCSFWEISVWRTRKTEIDRYSCVFRTSRPLMQCTKRQNVLANHLPKVSILNLTFHGINKACSDEDFWVDIRKVSNTKAFMEVAVDQNFHAIQQIEDFFSELVHQTFKVSNGELCGGNQAWIHSITSVEVSRSIKKNFSFWN